MDQQQIDLVQTSFAKVAPIADTASALFYDDLFERAPGVRPLFSEDLTEQRRKLMQMLGFAVAGLSDWEQAVPAVRELGARHSSYGAEPAHFAAVGASLLATLEKGLGDDFTPEVREAWTTAFGIIAAEMQAGMESQAA
ncbi:globin family protein [Agromyces archimandritae]|uniref:Globin domain-containing protein n=1 Tax=Agromyces archimandritae TaxID=2781962 RepID=A0A975FPS0_9MICO|nr:globin family protein [Agromyces archimandritae]QTX04936.1 hypothetical protein G127AT_01385 [Agromyces archimandritae]